MGKAEATTISFISMEVLFEDDCLEIMRALPSESVDMIFADPPFNVGKKYGGSPILITARIIMSGVPTGLPRVSGS